jgi:hypothetical protein
MDDDLVNLTRSLKRLCEEAVQSAQKQCMRMMDDEAKHGLDERVLVRIKDEYYYAAANTTGKMARLAQGVTGRTAQPVWDVLEGALIELRDMLSEDLSRFFRDEVRWAPSDARQTLAKGFYTAVHGAITAFVDDVRHGRMTVQPS